MTSLIDSHDTIYVDGRWTASEADEGIEVVSPWTEQIFGSVPSSTRGDVDRAVSAAHCRPDAYRLGPRD